MVAIKATSTVSKKMAEMCVSVIFALLQTFFLSLARLVVKTTPGFNWLKPPWSVLPKMVNIGRLKILEVEWSYS